MQHEGKGLNDSAAGMGRESKGGQRWRAAIASCSEADAPAREDADNEWGERLTKGDGGRESP